MSPNLGEFKRQIAEKRAENLARIRQVPVAALVWGPNPASTDPIATARLKLRDALRAVGHVADFSEELYDPASTLSAFAQQVAQAEAYDVIFSIPGSFGAVAEVHDFARLPGISRKVIAFVDELHMQGYSHQSLIAAQTSASCKVEIYSGVKLPDCIIEYALREVSRLQELLYLSGRR
jgi:hypothetical protein